MAPRRHLLARVAATAASAAAARAWSCTTTSPSDGTSTTLTVAWPTYALAVNGVPWAGNGDIQLRDPAKAGGWFSAAAGTIAQAGNGTFSGTDSWGAFTGLYQNLTTASGAPLAAEYRCYTGAGPVLFDLVFPAGAAGVNGSYPSGPGGSVVGPGDPTTFFPCFAGGKGDFWSEAAGTLRHGGIWTLWEWWGQGAGSLPYGIQGGPLYTFNTTIAPAVGAPAGAPTKPTTGILSPVTHFHHTLGGAVADRSGMGFPARTGFGLASTVVDVPPGYATSVGFFAGEGVTATTYYAYGAAMRARYGTKRLVGPGAMPRAALTEKVSYWTDNGAVHFQSWWDRACKRNCTVEESPQELMLALKRSFNAMDIPFGIYQLDVSGRAAGV